MFVSDRHSGEDFGKVAVLMGGTSAEREISLLSGKAVLESLNNSGIEAIGIDVSKNLLNELNDEKVDRVFICLHGKNGEDGKMQAVMEFIDMPYTGSGVTSSALAMDKIKCKQIWQSQNLLTPKFEVLNSNADWKEIIEKLSCAFVKPVSEGSSKGIRKVSSAIDLQQAYQEALQFDSEVIAEQWVDGPEYSVTILSNI